MIVAFLPRARERISIVAAWWRQNRPITPALFDEELEALVDRLKAHPFIGTEYESVDGEMIRKAPLRKSSQDVYYSVDEANQVIYIHTVWGARREKPSF